MSMGHGTWGFQGHYGAWVRDQVGPAQFERFQHPELPGKRFEAEGCDVDMPLRFHQTVWAADRAIDFLRTRDRTVPFLLALGFADPHHPHLLPREWTDRVDPAAVPLPDYDPGELDDKPEHFRLTRNGQIEHSTWRGQYEVAGQYRGEDYRRINEAQERRARAYYYTMVKLIDVHLGRVLTELAQLGLERDTLVIFTTDHGELLGDHGLWLKGPYLYEQLVRVPLILRYPAGVTAGRQVGSLVSHVDLVPTILSYAGLPHPTDVDGVDLAPVLAGQAASARDAVLIEHVDDPKKLRLKTVVTETRKLTYYAGQQFGELFDLERDPREKVNRWSDPAYAADKATLFGRLADFLEPLDKRAPRPYYV
jgi:arylsulfatase A-like enzyme